MSDITPELSATKKNWFYGLLNVACLLFIVTALAYAVVPVLEDKAADAGQPAPNSPLRAALREHGWWWLLVLAGIIGLLALASMGLDRWRQRKEVPLAEWDQGPGRRPGPTA